MDTHSPGIKWTEHEAGWSAGGQDELAPGWLAGSGGLHSPVWPGVLALLLAMGLLLAFHQVVNGAVLKGDLQRKAAAMHAEASWRCNAMRGLKASAGCLFQLNEASGGDARVRGRTIAAGEAVE